MRRGMGALPGASGEDQRGEGTLGAGTRYTCPMHPAVLRDEPGPCPECDMALEPVQPYSPDSGGEQP